MQNGKKTKMKILNEQKGFAMEYEVLYEKKQFLVVIIKIATIYRFIVLDENGKIVDSEPFKAIIDNASKMF